VSTIDAPPKPFLERNSPKELWAMWTKVDGWLNDPNRVMNSLDRWNCTAFCETVKDELLRRATL
jgi:hypothetical protein